MRLGKPSPAMVVAIIALIMASTGSAVAAVSFARNAGAVDRLSAVPSRVSTNKAAGKLVATQPRGAGKGKFASKFLSGVPISGTFGLYLPVNDNQPGAPNDLDSNALGKLTAACNDQSAIAGREDPSVVVSYINSTSGLVNFARTVGGNAPVMSAVGAGTVNNVTINGSNTFEIHLAQFATNIIYKGMVRQDGAGTADAKCLVVGTVETIK
ncbi:MAG: hypothetical protein QOE08_1144 [Thermoleophilaceae bacterium]|nr:hypothetical protein [Thermoleophilaceae bacterium]